MFTQKHINALAKTVATMPVVYRLPVADALADMLATSNPKFDRAKFYKACSVLTIEEAATSLDDRLANSFKSGSFSVGVEGDTIVVYEHVRGLKPFRVGTGRMYEGYPIAYRYVGKARAA